MKTLWTHGCSFTADWYLPKSDGAPSVNNYTKFRDYLGGTLPDVWPQLLSNELNMELKNLGEGGNSNYSIFETVCKSSPFYKKGDVVIIGWTFLGRFRQLDDNTHSHRRFRLDENWGFTEVLPSNFNDYSGLLSLNTVQDISVHRDNHRWKYEIHDYMKLIKSLATSVGFELYFWSADDRILHMKEDVESMRDYNIFFPDNRQGTFHELKKRGATSIMEECNYIEDEAHMGARGHEVQSREFLGEIKRFRNLSLDVS